MMTMTMTMTMMNKLTYGIHHVVQNCQTKTLSVVFHVSYFKPGSISRVKPKHCIQWCHTIIVSFPASNIQKSAETDTYKKMFYFTLFLNVSCLFIIEGENFFFQISIINERKSEQAHILHAPTLLENAVYNNWQIRE